MPEMSGLEIMEELEKAKLPCQCILLTSHSLASFDSDVEKSPILFQYVQKPVKKQDIISASKELSKKWKKHNPSPMGSLVAIPAHFWKVLL